MPDEVVDRMFYVYILKSTKNGDVYVGYSTDLKQRIGQHGSGSVRSTKAYRPWVLVYYEGYLNKFDATKREKQLKMHAAKNVLLQQIELSLSEAGKIDSS